MSGYDTGTLERVSRTTYTPVQDWQKVPTFDQVLMKNAEVARWWATAGPVCARLRGVPERLMALLKEQRDAINALALDDTLSSKGRFDKELALKNAALQAIDQVATDAKEDVEQLEF